jgi:hypothetical protein
MYTLQTFNFKKRILRTEKIFSSHYKKKLKELGHIIYQNDPLDEYIINMYE